MKHALGFDHITPKRGVIESYRNYYQTSDRDADWEEAVAAGYAKVREGDGSFDRGFWYGVTEQGIEMLEQIIGLKIKKTY